MRNTEQTTIAKKDAAPEKPGFLLTLKRQKERVALALLGLWCVLPVIVFFVFLISGARGKYPTEEQLAALGLELGATNYVAALRAYQTLFFVLGGVTVGFVVICLFLHRRSVFSRQALKENPWCGLFALFLLWCCVSTLLADYRQHALLGGMYVRDGLLSYFIYGGVFLSASMIRREDARRIIFRLFVVVITLLALFMFLQEGLRNPFLDYCFPSFKATVFNQFNHFGYMLCMAAALSLGLYLYDDAIDRQLRILYLEALFFLTCALIFNNTLGALLAELGALPVILLMYRGSGQERDRRSAAAALGVVLGAVLFCCLLPATRALLQKNLYQLLTDLNLMRAEAGGADVVGTGRLGLWRETLEKIRERPVFGFGPEGLVGENAISENKLAHNTYLQIAADAGIPGLGFYLAAVVLIAVRTVRNRRRMPPMALAAAGAVAAYLISQTFGCPVFNTEPYFWLMLGLAAFDSCGSGA